MIKRSSGFTIVEVIVVIVIIGILLGVVFISMRSFGNRSNKSSAVNTAEEVKLQLSTYFRNRNRYPKTQSDVVDYLTAQKATDLATKFGNTAVYSYTATKADGSPCALTGIDTCDKYTITVKKTYWNAPASDSDVLVTP